LNVDALADRKEELKALPDPETLTTPAEKKAAATARAAVESGNQKNRPNPGGLEKERRSRITAIKESDGTPWVGDARGEDDGSVHRTGKHARMVGRRSGRVQFGRPGRSYSCWRESSSVATRVRLRQGETAALSGPPGLQPAKSDAKRAKFDEKEMA
jgi:hypothetical protein